MDAFSGAFLINAVGANSLVLLSVATAISLS